MIKPIEYIDGIVRLLDQTKLPLEKTHVDCRNIAEVGAAIRDMIVRGAPAIGVTAALGASLGADKTDASDFSEFFQKWSVLLDALKQARPTAVNLSWAVEKMKKIALDNKHLSVPDLKNKLRQSAIDFIDEDISINRGIGSEGNGLINTDQTILTHCNAGALATAGYGTALGVVRAAHESGKSIHVFSNETRPFLQGARLTTWELKEDKIPVTLITDNMCGHFMRLGKIDMVIVGADRIAGNGDVANKIGTYMVAVLAEKHKIPFYVAAPISTLDLTLKDGDQIPIEERSSEEVLRFKSERIAPDEVEAAHPAFDITPNELVTAIITEKGIARPPFTDSLRRLATGK